MCSFGLRTIAVLMSLFPSLGISSFLTAVCCDGENEYTTHAPRCQQDFAFFLDFFAFFFAGCGRLVTLSLTQGLCKLWHASSTPALREPQGPECRDLRSIFISSGMQLLLGPSTGLGTGIRQSAGAGCRHKGGGRHFCKVKCQLGQIPNQVRDDGLRWGWLAFTDSGSEPGIL